MTLYTLTGSIGSSKYSTPVLMAELLMSLSPKIEMSHGKA